MKASTDAVKAKRNEDDVTTVKKSARSLSISGWRVTGLSIASSHCSGDLHEVECRRPVVGRMTLEPQEPELIAGATGAGDAAAAPEVCISWRACTVARFVDNVCSIVNIADISEVVAAGGGGGG